MTGKESPLNSPLTPIETRRQEAYGWRRDLPDPRDMRFAAAPEVALALPASADLRAGLPPVWFQGQAGTCVAHSVKAAYMYDAARQKLPPYDPSILDLYWNARNLEGCADADTGCEIRDAVKVLATLGVCSSELWPYDLRQVNVRPPEDTYVLGRQHEATVYRRVGQDITQLESCLASGYPVVVGITVFDNFEGSAAAQTGRIGLPRPGDAMKGGHAILLTGYDHIQATWTLRNSWGPQWGMAGYFTLPYAYLTDPQLAGDFWTIQVVS